MTVSWARGCVLGCLALASVACQSKSDDSSSTAQAQKQDVLLSGRFQSVGKRVSGAVELRANGDAYELKLSGVTLKYDGPVRVYLVGLPDADTTAKVDSTELKYDMGPLENGAATQVIELPSAPHPDLRSVVLWNRKYGANLAVAALRE